jgi:hypothetical protein
MCVLDVGPLLVEESYRITHLGDNCRMKAENKAETLDAVNIIANT